MTIYARRVRYRDLDRLRHSDEFLAFLDTQAERISTLDADPGSVTAEDIFNSMKSGKTAEQVEAVTTGGDL